MRANDEQVDKIIDDLVSPKDPSQQAYHVVAPSLPGFVFSEGSKSQDFEIRDMAAIDHKLMLALGYDKYIAQGGDWGSIVVRILGVDYPDHCVGAHINMIFSGPPSFFRAPLSLLYLPIWAIMQGEGSKFKRMLWWQKEEMGYFEIQGTKPQTLSYALADSPIGMLAWIRDKVQHLVDDDFMLSEEEIITWAMLYLIPGTAGHVEIYKNAKDPKKLERLMKAIGGKVMGKEVDFGASIFPKGMFGLVDG
jgi:pimeloyl-ACP methyl ester carboxylesterase